MTLPLTYPPIDTQRGGDVDLAREELAHVIEWAAARHPRSLQQLIGPSEIGTPCDRKLGFKLAQTPPTGRARLAWRTIVGTAVHTWLADHFEQYNAQLGFTRYLVEAQVDIGEVDGVNILGHCDVYDRVTCLTVDWKIVGKASLARARASGPSPTYQTQGHAYGRGWTRRGLPVDNVAIYYLPASGEFSEAVFWSEPYDEQKAIDALARAERIRQAQKMVGAQAVNNALPIAEDYCVTCPWFAPRIDKPNCCPGALANRRDSLESLIPKQAEGEPHGQK